MPIDYKNYPKNWKTVIRPDILKRANNKCEFCNVPNCIVIIRGERGGREVYQDDNGSIFDANDSEHIGDDYLGVGFDKPFTTIVLTIAHLDHDINNNDYSNLKALCQRCHNRYDKDYRKANRAANKLAKQPQLFK